MEVVILNAIGRVRRETVDGRTYLVAPITSIVPGVLAGSKGPLYYPADEISRNHDQWNGMPLVMYHPTNDQNQPVSARSPKVLSKHGIGTVYGTTFNGRLKHEGWFDEEKTKSADKRFGTDVHGRLTRNEPIEMSTGLFTDNHPARPNSNHRGRPYDFIARNYRPDHIAVLPDQRGACSVEDGCGVNINGAVVNKLDRLGGEMPSVDRKALKMADFITLPKGESGTNCGNCRYVEKDGDGHVCTNSHLDGQPVTARNCCAYWDSAGTLRVWDKGTQNAFERDSGGRFTAEEEESGEAEEELGKKKAEDAKPSKGKDKKEAKPEHAAAAGSAEASSRTQAYADKLAKNEGKCGMKLAGNTRVCDLATNASPNQQRHQESGQYLPHGAGVGKGPAHEAAKQGKDICPDCGKNSSDCTCDKPTSNSEILMDRDQIIEHLTTNCDCWKGGAETLNTLSNEQLEKLKIKNDQFRVLNSTLGTIAKDLKAPAGLTVNAMPAFIKKKIAANDGGIASADGAASTDGDDQAGGEEDDDSDDQGKAAKGKSGGKGKLPPMMNMAQFEAAMPPQARAVWNNAKEIESQARQQLVARLVANVQDGDLRERLIKNHMKKDLQVLRDEVAALPQGQTQTHNGQLRFGEETPAPNFFGAGAPAAPRPTTNHDASDVLPLPTINWEEWAEGNASPQRRRQKQA